MFSLGLVLGDLQLTQNLPFLFYKLYEIYFIEDIRLEHDNEQRYNHVKKWAKLFDSTVQIYPQKDVLITLNNQRWYSVEFSKNKHDQTLAFPSENPAM